jgi:hypothetical protein
LVLAVMSAMRELLALPSFAACHSGVRCCIRPPRSLESEAAAAGRVYRIVERGAP